MDFKGPQTDIPVGNNSSQGDTTTISSGWQGMTIKDILEKVDLFNFTMLSDEEKDAKKEKEQSPDITETVVVKPKPIKIEQKSAFLGPKIWQTPITLNQLTEEDNDEEGVENNVDVAGAEFSVMNIDDFLQENNFDFGNVSPTTRDIYAVESRGQRSMIKDVYRRREVSPPESDPSEYSDYSMMDTDQTFTTESVGSPPSSKKPKIELPKGDNTFLYVESKRARMEREREERRRREEARIEFSAEELALATVPGADFDPTARQFSMEELRPQPIIRKRRKSYVQPDKKDDKYWEKRNKNNVAARRSREARRLKENQISLRTAFLEQQNRALLATVTEAKEKHDKLLLETRKLTEKLKKYQTVSPFLNTVD